MGEKMTSQLFVGNAYTLLNKETAAIEGEKIIMKKVSAAKFMRVYLEDIGALVRLSDGEIKVLQCIWEISEYNTGRVILVSSVKKDIQEKLSKNGKPMQMASMNNLISKLAKREILIAVPDRSATYILNPKFFWKGEEIERGNSFKLTVAYQYEGQVNEEIQGNSESGE